MGSDFGKALPIVTTIAAAAVGFYVGGPGGSAWAGAAIGSGVGATAGQLAQPLTGYDPMGDIRDAAESQARANADAIDQWRKQQDELFTYQKRELENLAPLQDEFTKQYGDILTGKTDVASSPMFSSLFANLRQAEATQIARINETMPEGGAKERAIRQARQVYADEAGKITGQIQKQIFDLAAGINLPYGSVAGGSVPAGSTDYGALAQMQPSGIDPMAGLNMLAAYRTAGGGKTTAPAATAQPRGGYAFPEASYKQSYSDVQPPM